MTGIERFSEIMDEKPDITDAPNAKELKNVKGDIEFHNVSFSYDNNEESFGKHQYKDRFRENRCLGRAFGGGKQLMPSYPAVSTKLMTAIYPLMDGYKGVYP